ncbi:DEAD/DEAH box helicase [Peribacillus kribbensis]|uniref:DEAD/DEAH box helicase n=1 Tax=Peribacillus kribbensis TaxID=356658 RepID=UPI0003FA699C|nr:DEAD/DEAH box helicase [Peribacillus kribbensis]
MSKTSFNNYSLSPEILKALEGLRYTSPTKIQEKVIPPAMEKRDLVVKSQTGSGKTASFAIPICECLRWEENKPQALVLTPTRELAVQVQQEISRIGRFKRVKALALYGKASFEKQKIELKQKNHVVVGTPGRILDHLQKGTLRMENLSHLVIDEADEMLNMGFIDQVEGIISYLPESRVNMLFSATIPPDIESLSRDYMHMPLKIELEASLTVPSIEHAFIRTEQDEKLSILKNLTVLENPDSCIIFCRTQERVGTLYDRLESEGYPVDMLHGGMRQEDRFAVMDDFKLGLFRYLVATDVAARGLDIENISMVVNYDIPMETEGYVHRTGRTGRAGRSGKAFTFVNPGEEPFLQDIEAYIGFSIPLMEAPTEEQAAGKRASFEKKIYARPDIKKARDEEINKNISKLYFNGGKKKKIRPVDFVGTITSIPGITAEDIGIISIQEQASFVDILNGKGQRVLEEMKNRTVKGKVLKVHIAKK